MADNSTQNARLRGPFQWPLAGLFQVVATGVIQLRDKLGNVIVSVSSTAVALAVGAVTRLQLDATRGVVETFRLPVTGLSGSANVFASAANPFGYPVIITRAIFYSTTIATAAATLDMGVAADATTGSDLLMDGLDVNSATGVFDNLTNPGTNGLRNGLWPTASFLNVKEASGNVNGLVGHLIVECIKADAT